MSDISAKDFGRLEEKTAHLEAELEEIKRDVKAIRSNLDQARGAGRTMVMIAGFVATVSGALGAAGAWFLKS